MPACEVIWPGTASGDVNVETKRTTDHDTIRQWALERAGVPATAGDELRIDFPEGGGHESPEHVSWEEWFRKFEEEELCFLYQEEKATGEASTFFKLRPRQG
jgi:hypothetical protein